MRLTKTDRDAFVRAVMDDVPSIDFDEQIRVLAQKLAKETVPAAVLPLLSYPKLADYLEHSYVSVYAHRKEAEFRSDSRVYVSVNFAFHVPSAGIESIKKAIQPLIDSKAKQEDDRCILERKVRGAALAATTREGLVKLLPEMEKYIPANAVPSGDRMVPVIANLMTDLTRAGFPKGKPPAATPAAKKTSKRIPASS